MSGWFVRNLRDASWMDHDAFGATAVFEEAMFAAPGAEGRFAIGLNVRVLQPGQPNGLYHREDDEEHFLVLAGEALLIVEGEERTVRAWDVVHCPPQTAHIFVGAGDGPCAILMVGGRARQRPPSYPVDDAALRHGAGVATATDDPAEAYGAHERPAPGDPPPGMPWSAPA